MDFFPIHVGLFPELRAFHENRVLDGREIFRQFPGLRAEPQKEEALALAHAVIRARPIGQRLALTDLVDHLEAVGPDLHASSV